MRRLLALAALVAAMPAAYAQDKGKSEFTPSAEYRPRYFFMQNNKMKPPPAAAGSMASDSFAEHRFKMGANYKANEKFNAHITLLHAADFGSANGPIGTTNTADINNSSDSGNQENFLNVNEAYMNWMSSDDMTFRIGRQNFQIADGTVMGYNDWEQNPYAFDGVTGVWEAEFGRFTGMLFNYKEEAATATASDPKHTAYGLSFDLKTMPDYMKMVNAHVIKDNADASNPSSGTTVSSDVGQDTLRYGVGLGFDFGLVDVKAHYEMNTGKYKSQPATAGSSLDAKQSMYQAEVGFKLESFMASRLYAMYHVDSGDSNALDGDAESYDPYFYERHNTAGLMDIFGWGNLTHLALGWTLKPGESTDAGLSYNMFSMTEGKGTINFQRFGSLGNGSGTSDKLGDEVDLWAEHRYDGGLSTMLRLGYFMPGDRFDNSTSKQDDAILHVAVEGKLTF